MARDPFVNLRLTMIIEAGLLSPWVTFHTVSKSSSTSSSLASVRIVPHRPFIHPY